MTLYIKNGILYSGSLDEDDKPINRGQTRKRKAKDADYKNKNIKNLDGGLGGLMKSFKKGVSDLLKSDDKEKKKKKPKNSLASMINFGGNRGGMPSKRVGSIDYRKGGMVVNTTDNRKNK